MRQEPDKDDTSTTEMYINYVCTNAVPKAMTLHKVKVATQTDPTMQALSKAIKSDKWSDPLTQEFHKVNPIRPGGGGF